MRNFATDDNIGFWEDRITFLIDFARYRISSIWTKKKWRGFVSWRFGQKQKSDDGEFEYCRFERKVEKGGASWNKNITKHARNHPICICHCNVVKKWIMFRICPTDWITLSQLIGWVVCSFGSISKSSLWNEKKRILPTDSGSLSPWIKGKQAAAASKG